MAWTTDQLTAAIDALKTALAAGEKAVTYGDRSTTYRSVEEMRESLRMFETELASLTGDPRPRVWLGSASKGL